MVKKISVIALVGVLALPVAAIAGAGSATNSELEAKIEQLTKDFQKEVAQLRSQIKNHDEKFEAVDEKSESWDLASRIQLSGDIRARHDVHSADTVPYYSANTVAYGAEAFLTQAPAFNGAQIAAFMATIGPTAAADVGGVMAAYGWADFSGLQNMQQLMGFMKAVTPQTRVAVFNAMQAFGMIPAGNLVTQAAKYENDSLWTTRFRMNMRAKATENVDIKARIVGYKTWGMQDSSMPETNGNGIHDTSSPYYLNSRSFDGTSGRQPVNNLLVLDRAFVNWNNIGGQPIWFSIGRRPTTDGPPTHLRMGVDERLATTTAVMDYPFDGISLGYAYSDLFGLTGAPGRIRFCYGRGFEAGPNQKDTGVNDVDFAGFNWDIYQKGNRFINLQSFVAANLFNVPGDTQFPNPFEMARATQGLLSGTMTFDPTSGKYLNADGSVALENTYLDRMNMGNVFHTSGVYMDKIQDMNYFVAGGWSHTDPKGVDEMGISLLGDNFDAPESQDGFCLYVGARYDIPNSSFKIGAEYNYGSKYWLGFTPGHDDQYASKLYTRGSVYEIYGIYDIPSGETISKYGKAFMRLGYQHFDYDYTYSGMWLGSPNKVDDIKNDPLMAQFYAPLDEIDQVYLTFEAFF